LPSRLKRTDMPNVVEKLTGGEPLAIDQIIEYLPALKKVARAQLDNWAKTTTVLHRYKKGEIVCEEGDFGSTTFFILSGSVDIFIHNPWSHLGTQLSTPGCVYTCPHDAAKRVDPRLFFGRAIEAQTMLFKTAARRQSGQIRT
jgi:CRP-like cAMP-binding protein